MPFNDHDTIVLRHPRGREVPAVRLADPKARLDYPEIFGSGRLGTPGMPVDGRQIRLL
jgi:hypothetical protein